MREKIEEVIKGKKLSIKEICQLTQLSRTTVKRYCDQIGYAPSRHQAWNKGLSKDKNNSLMKISNKLNGIKRGRRDLKIKNKISNTMKLNGTSGGYRRGSGRGQNYNVNGIILPSYFQYQIAKALYRDDIEWKQPDKFRVVIDGVSKDHYFDFYLPQYNLYLSVKENTTNDIRYRANEAVKQNYLQHLFIDSFLYKRILYNGMKNILENVLKK